VKGVGRTALAVTVVVVCLIVGIGLSGCGAVKGKRLPETKNSADALAAGDAALARGDRNEAGRLYLTALKNGADAATVHTRLGDLYLGSGVAVDKARSEYETALRANAKFAPAMQGLGFALYLGGAQTQAAAMLQKALERDPGLSRAAALLGTIENRQGHPDAALAIFDKSLAVAFDPDVENNRGLSLMLLGRSEDAVAAFRKALAAKKTAKIANNLGLALCRLGRFDEAYATFASVGSESAALNNVGVCFMEAGDKARAQQYFERAIATNPSYYEKAQTNLSRLSATEEVNLPSAPAVAPSATQPPASSAAKAPPAPPVPAAAVGQARPFTSVPPEARPAGDNKAARAATPPARPDRNAAAAEKVDRSEMP